MSIKLFTILLETILDRFKIVSDRVKCMFTVISTRKTTENITNEQSINDIKIIKFKMKFIQIHLI